MSTIDDRITAALQAAANQVTESNLPPAQPPTAATHGSPPRRHVRWVAPLIAAAAVAGVAITLTAVAAHHPTAAPPIKPGLSTSTQLPAPSTTTSTTQSTPSAPSTSPDGSFAMACYFADTGCDGSPGKRWFVPLWPYENYNQVQDAETIGCAMAPCTPVWHFDAGATALKFVQSYLGFSDIRMMTSSTINGDQAYIGVGYAAPGAKSKTTAAVLHLVRYVDRPNTAGPWEVVGSEDTSFTLEKPAYGSQVIGGFTAGGHITGVDENIHVSVLAVNARSPIADECCIAAGGNDQPWSQGVGIPSLLVIGPQHSTPVTIVASTGGHVQQHERFAIQGVWLITTGS